MAKKSTATTVTAHLRRLAEYLDNEPAAARKFAAAGFNAWMKDLTAEDFFGTEGQSDPRGDQRDN